MNRISRKNALLVMLLGMSTGTWAEDSSIPGILQYAMKHQESQPESAPATKKGSEEPNQRAVKTPRAGRLDGLPLTVITLKRRLQQQEQEMSQLRLENRQLRSVKPVPALPDRSAEIAGLQKRAEQAESTVSQLKASMDGLSGQLKQVQQGAEHDRTVQLATVIDLKQQLAAAVLAKQPSSETTTRETALTKRAEKAEQEASALKRSTVALNQSVASLTTQVADLQAQGSNAATREATLAQRAEKAEQEVGTLKASALALNQNIASLATRVSDLTGQLAQMPVMTSEALNVPEVRQSYATGVMAGQDIHNSQLPGLKTDERALIAGIRDALNQKVLLNTDALQAALNGAQDQAQQVVKNTLQVQKTAGEAYTASFRQRNKGVKQDKSGFWYHMDYAGDGPPIAGDETSVEVVVTEKLVDGTVVEDMDASGRSLTLALSDFPPLFRSALVLMKNHGAMTLVAPPQLAYGDAGYPPKVPPGATMVYRLRVDNVKPAPEMDLPDVKAIKAQQATDGGKAGGSKQK